MEPGARTSPLPDHHQQRLRTLLAERGEGAVVALLGLPRQTLARCSGGLPVRAGTAALVAAALERLAANPGG